MGRITGPEFTTKAMRDRNRPILKQSKASIWAALAAHDRIQAVSDEIRARHGLKPVPESDMVKRWVAKVSGSKKAPRTLAERASALAASRVKLERERAKVDRELAEIAAAVKGTGEVTKVALVLGLSRQRLYQLAA